jgi:hypothetical protein
MMRHSSHVAALAIALALVGITMITMGTFFLHPCRPQRCAPHHSSRATSPQLRRLLWRRLTADNEALAVENWPPACLGMVEALLCFASVTALLCCLMEGLAAMWEHSQNSPHGLTWRCYGQGSAVVRGMSCWQHIPRRRSWQSRSSVSSLFTGYCYMLPWTMGIYLHTLSVYIMRAVCCKPQALTQGRAAGPAASRV